MKNVNIFYKYIPGYLSTDEKAYIFIKDEEITNKEITNKPWYIPIIKLSNCKSLKDGIYKDFNTIYCFTDELDFCINDLKKSLEMELDELIQDAENHV